MEKFNIDNVIKAALNEERKETPKDIEKHPLDHLDILIEQCTEENCEEIIKKITKIFEVYPQKEIGKLIEEFISQVDDQINIALSEKAKCEHIEDLEIKLTAKAKSDNKIRALTKLNRTFKGEE